jgi:hypothetical protein
MIFYPVHQFNVIICLNIGKKLLARGNLKTIQPQQKGYLRNNYILLVLNPKRE